MSEKTCLEILTEWETPNASAVAELIRRKCDERGVVLANVSIENGLTKTEEGHIRFAIGGTGSFHIDPVAVRVIH